MVTRRLLLAYEYPFTVAVGPSSVDLSKSKPTVVATAGMSGNRIETIPTPSNMFNPKLIAILEGSNRKEVLEGMYWANEPIAISQAIAPTEVDRFLVALAPSDPYSLRGQCAGGLQYTARLVIVYDKTSVIVSDSFRFVLAGGKSTHLLPLPTDQELQSYSEP